MKANYQIALALLVAVFTGCASAQIPPPLPPKPVAQTPVQVIATVPDTNAVVIAPYGAPLYAVSINSADNGWNLVDYTISVNQTPGIIANGIDYNGASGGLRYTGSTPQNYLSSTNWSVSTWVYVPSGSSSVAVFYQDGVCQFGSNIDASSLYIYYFRSSDGGSSLDTGVSCLMEINDVLPFDQWFHMCFTYDLNANLVKMYLNGDVLSTSYVGGDWFDVGWPQELEMGYGANGETDYYVGTDFQQDETACWNAVLTQEQVTQLYNAGLGLPYSSFTH